MGSLQGFATAHCGHEPGVAASRQSAAVRGNNQPAALCRDAATRIRFMESEHLQNSDVSWGHEPTPNPSGGGESVSGTLAEFPSWEGSGVGRFMESPLSFFRMHWDHEPPLTRPPATLSPWDGEREGVRGRFMEREKVSGV